MENFFLSYLRPGDNVVDVGSNIGWYSLLCADRVGAEGSVYTFEAHPRTFGYLVENVKLNNLNNLRLFQSALGSKRQLTAFTDKREDDMNAVAEDGEIEVPQALLDDFPIRTPIELLKIDVEGFELFVLQGAETILASTHTILFEAWQEHFDNFGYAFEDIQNVLNRSGFSCYLKDGDGYRLIEPGFTPHELIDVVATRSFERLAQRL